MAGRRNDISYSNYTIIDTIKLKGDLQLFASRVGAKEGYTEYLRKNKIGVNLIPRSRKSYIKYKGDPTYYGIYGRANTDCFRELCEFAGLNTEDYAVSSDGNAKKAESTSRDIAPITEREILSNQRKRSVDAESFVIVDATGLRSAMQDNAYSRHEGVTYSKYIDTLGIPNGCIGQAIDKYRRIFKDFRSPNLGYMLTERYLTLCDFFELNPCDYSKDYAERFAHEEKQEEITVADVNIEKKLDSILEALNELNNTLNRIGNVDIQILEKLPARKPVATLNNYLK